jgi:O-glycosyl hydrolase
VSAKASANGVVNLGANRQVIQGFGSSSRSWSDPHLANAPTVNVPASAQAEILTALYRSLGLTMDRVILDSGVEAQSGAPLNFAGKVDAQIAFAKQAQRFGLKTFFPAPDYLEPWMQPSDPGAMVNWAMSMLQHWRTLGVTPPYYSIINEPQVARNFPPQWLHDVVVQLGQRMRAAGLKTKLVIPDDENPIDAYRRARAVLDDPQARQYVGAVAFHIYRIGAPADWVPLRQLASRYGLPLWMTEYWNASYASYSGALSWATTMHQLLTIGGVNSIDYIFGFFGDWASGASGAPISIRFNNGAFVSWSKTPIYNFIGQYSKYVRPGYRRVDASSDDPGVLVSAYKGPKRVVVVAINTASDARPLKLRIIGGKIAAKLAVVQTTSSAGLAPSAPIRTRSGTVSTTLPPQSVTTFVSAR